MGDGLQILYLLLAALFMAVTTARSVRGRPIGWKVSAALVWLAIFVAAAFFAERLGLRLPNGGGGF
jgi:hypothetical protein